VLHFGFDNDDKELMSNLRAAGPCRFTTSNRMGLAAWTNHLASLNMDAPYLASIGDDMVPTSPGWDRLLVEGQREVGGGFTYPELGRGIQHGRQPDIPEAVVVDTRIVLALGWMCLPALTHWYVDNVWRDLGVGAGCFRCVPDAIVLHKHPNVPGGDKPDATYTAAARSFDSDAVIYRRWRLREMRKDTATVRGVRETIAHPLGHR
jgi:hypothetical protein